MATTTTTAGAAVASPDGEIVPFSTLPACASLCGPLFDVQGACAPPKLSTIEPSCFCSDSRLTSFDDSGTSGVSSVCGALSCTAAADLQALKTWYEDYCSSIDSDSTTTTTAGGAASTSTGSSSSSSSSSKHTSTAGTTWLDGHWKWVVMLVVMFVAIVGGWIIACMFRRRYLRKKEKEIEMRPPVAWGPHQMQQATGGYTYGDGVVDTNHTPIGPVDSPGGYQKELVAQPAPTKGKRLSKRGFFGIGKN